MEQDALFEMDRIGQTVIADFGHAVGQVWDQLVVLVEDIKAVVKQLGGRSPIHRWPGFGGIKAGKVLWVTNEQRPAIANINLHFLNFGHNTGDFDFLSLFNNCLGDDPRHLNLLLNNSCYLNLLSLGLAGNEQ